ncbi:MAG: DUF6489 family protein, partial [Erythrobacter sp.]|nr:DUF6489 family protein [Erythrobacter sp.]
MKMAPCLVCGRHRGCPSRRGRCCCALRCPIGIGYGKPRWHLHYDCSGRGVRSMKISIEIDCTPEEARAFMGLPDV